MSDYKTIKELVIEAYKAEKSPSYEDITARVREHFPGSKWQRSHYSWYKSQIKTGRIKIDQPEEDVNGDANDIDIEDEIDESIQIGVSLEKDLHKYFIYKINEIEPGLTLVKGGSEYSTPAGRIDLLASSSDNQLVVIELKAGKANDSALGQLLGYMGALSASNPKVRGILVASSFEERVILAIKALPNVKLVQYELSFNLKKIAP